MSGTILTGLADLIERYGAQGARLTAHQKIVVIDDVLAFCGGIDLTPHYVDKKDAAYFHSQLKATCDRFSPDYYPAFKTWADDYFYIRHRKETRGIGGIFFDDLNQPGFEECFALVRSVGEHFLSAYLPILERRSDTPYGERERAFQAYRRGRYVEFNLVYDRGTLFGLQSGGRTESILMSLPPLARWEYGYVPAPRSPEEALARDWLRPRDWLGEA